MWIGLVFNGHDTTLDKVFSTCFNHKEFVNCYSDDSYWAVNQDDLIRMGSKVAKFAITSRMDQ